MMFRYSSIKFEFEHEEIKEALCCNCSNCVKSGHYRVNVACLDNINLEDFDISIFDGASLS